MEFTSASASKYIKSLQEEKDFLLDKEISVCTYTVSSNETPEPPYYDYGETRNEIDSLDKRILILKNAIHAFNIRTQLPECGLTIDEALVALAQMNKKKSRLSTLRNMRQKERTRGRLYLGDSNIVEYTYANYDIARADQDYRKLCDDIAKLQLEIDLANQTIPFEVEL